MTFNYPYPISRSRHYLMLNISEMGYEIHTWFQWRDVHTILKGVISNDLE